MMNRKRAILNFGKGKERVKNYNLCAYQSGKIKLFLKSYKFDFGEYKKLNKIEKLLRNNNIINNLKLVIFDEKVNCIFESCGIKKLDDEKGMLKEISKYKNAFNLYNEGEKYFKELLTYPIGEGKQMIIMKTSGSIEITAQAEDTVENFEIFDKVGKLLINNSIINDCIITRYNKEGRELNYYRPNDYDYRGIEAEKYLKMIA